MKVLSKNLLTIITAIALFMLPILFAGCDAQNSYEKFLYDSVNNFYENRVDAENYISTTYKVKQVQNDKEEVELNYYPTATAAEKVTGKHTNTTDTTIEAQIALQKLEGGFQVYLGSKTTTVEVVNEVSDPDELLKTTTTTTVEGEEYYFYSKTQDTVTTYYIVKVITNKLNNEDAIVEKWYASTTDEDDYISEINNLIESASHVISNTFFNWSSMMMLFGDMITIDMNGDNLKVSFDADMMSIRNTTLIPSLSTTNIVIETTLNAPVKATQTDKRITKTTSSEIKTEMEVIQSASVVIPETLLDDATSTYYISTYQFFNELPELDTNILFGGIL